MPVNRNSQTSKTHGKPPKALNSMKKAATNSGKVTTKKRSSKKPASPPPVNSGFSLYSSGSESGDVSSLNRGLNRCAALLANIMDDDDSIVQHHGGSKKPLSQKGTPIKVGNKSQSKQINRSTAKNSKQIPSARKPLQRQGNTSKKLNSSAQKYAEKRLSSELTPNGKSAPIPILKEVQTTQFNDRLVSSTPDMGSPTSVTHEPNNEIPNQSINQTPAYRDASLEALAAQIQMLRSQAEKAEASQQQGPDHIPVRDTTHYVDSGNRYQLQDQPSVQPVIQQKQVDIPGQLLSTLSDHLRNVNMRNPVNLSQNMTPPLQYSQDPNLHKSQIKQHQMSNDRHQFLSPSKGKSTQNVIHPPTMSKPSHLSFVPFEQRDSRNTSFVGEYCPLPDSNIKPDGSSEQILNQLKDIETTSTTPIPPQSTFDVKSHPNIYQSRTLNQTNGTHIPTQLVHGSEVQSPYCNASPQLLTNQVEHHDIAPSEMTPNRTMQFTPRMICMGTQTYSPPADKGVQTSTISSPSSPETSSQESLDCKISDFGSNKNVSSREVTAAKLLDTPHRHPKFNSGKKSASWEQMRVLKFLLGELRAAIGEIGDDREVERLITEMQECMDTLQYLPPDLQIEIGLALQPLRSENSQLRRRLRIANQQIRQLQNGPEKENMEPPVDVEVLTLQTLNAKLQKELREEISEKKRLADSNAECMAMVDTLKQKQRDFMILLQQKDAHQLQSRQEWLEEKSAFKYQFDEMQSQLNDLNLRIEAVNKENNILQFSLKQRESEIVRLKENNDPIFPELNSDFHARDNDSISESDDDVTPTTSPQQSPHKIPDQTSIRTMDTYHHINPNLTKKVTFAEYYSPNATLIDNVVDVPRRHFDVTQHSDDNNMDNFKTPRPYSKQTGSNKYHVFDRGAPFQQDLSEDVLDEDNRIPNGIPNETNMVDKEFSMRKFLEQSRNFIRDESEAESSDGTQKLMSNLPSWKRTNQRDFSDDIRNEQFFSKSDDRGQNHDRTQFQSFPHGSSQEITFQGSALDRSVSSVDCTSTQSSVTSQYEAQFQLGLASLDSEIAKLQSSLKTMGQT